MADNPYIFKFQSLEIHCFFEGQFLVKLSFFDKTVEGINKLLQKNYIQTLHNLKDSDNHFSLLSNELYLYFSGLLKQFTQPIRFTMGSAFEQDVWLALREIPYGETKTYKWLSKRVGREGAHRAVGNALSKNPLPLVLPCHRVIASDGSLSGFSGGVELKRWLLDHEAMYKLNDNPKKSI